MPSVVGLLEEHEFAARRRVDGLREETDRVQAELAAAELERQEWVIARRRVGTVLAPEGDGTAGAEAVADPPDAEARSAPRDAAKAKSQVPVWRPGQAWSVLSVDCRRIITALADRARLGQDPSTCQEMAAAFGMVFGCLDFALTGDGDTPGALDGDRVRSERTVPCIRQGERESHADSGGPVPFAGTPGRRWGSGVSGVPAQASGLLVGVSVASAPSAGRSSVRRSAAAKGALGGLEKASPGLFLPYTGDCGGTGRLRPAGPCLHGYARFRSRGGHDGRAVPSGRAREGPGAVPAHPGRRGAS